MRQRSIFKAVVFTAILSICTLLLLIKLFYVSLFSAFGMTVVSAGALQSLNASRQMVQTMKARNAAKRSTAHKRFLKRASKKLVTTSVAAATLGTAAVAVATVGLEAEQYCLELEELESERAILEGRAASFDYEACASNAKSDLASIMDELKEEGSRWLDEAFEEP